VSGLSPLVLLPGRRRRQPATYAFAPIGPITWP
jgi:hypothetical protein